MNSITLIENEIKRQISFESDIAHLLNFHGLIFMSGTSFFFIIKRRKKYESKKITNTCNYAFFILIFEYTCNFLLSSIIFFSFFYLYKHKNNDIAPKHVSDFGKILCFVFVMNSSYFSN